MMSKLSARRWETPVSDVRKLSTVSILDDGVLEITVASEGHVWKFVFDCALCFRVTDEAFLNQLWSLRVEPQEIGSTFLLAGSNLLDELKADPGFSAATSARRSEPRHYVIATGDDGIEVISVDEPRIEKVSRVSLPDGSPVA